MPDDSTHPDAWVGCALKISAIRGATAQRTAIARLVPVTPSVLIPTLG